MPIRRLQNCRVVLLLLSLAGCGDVRDAFIEGRALDGCDGQWPVCAQVAGCLLGDKSYTTGRFPGAANVVVQLFEPSVVRASFYLEQVSAAGEQLVLSFFEEGCRARVRTAVTGKAFASEVELQGFFSREAELEGVGDHLLAFESDAQASYLLKVEVLPRRIEP